jgi:membrane-associated phospholipid phosphatase
MATIAIILVAGLQFFWGRDRYFAILEGLEGAGYTPWYLPQGSSISTDVAFRSFPSMHSSSAASMVTLIVFAWAFELKKPLKLTLILLAAVIMVCVPISRVTMGWHYPTDVLFGVFLAYAAAELALLIVDRLIYKNKAVDKNQQT